MNDGRSLSGNLLFLVRDPGGFGILTEKPEEINVDVEKRTWQHCSGDGKDYPSVPMQIGMSVINCEKGNHYGVIGVYWASQIDHLLHAVWQIMTGVQFQERFCSSSCLGRDMFLGGNYPATDLRRPLFFSGH